MAQCARAPAHRTQEPQATDDDKNAPKPLAQRPAASADAPEMAELLNAIIAENTGGLAFYGGLGTTEHQRIDNRVRKRLDL